ncbi:MAG TPA: capsule biosynthesis protein CapA, partial [Motiliproteus sp.]
MNQVVSPQRQGKRSFLFLQGCTSPFFARLGDQLRSLGHEVYRVNFNVGDAVYWWGRPAWHFRSPVKDLPAFLEQKFKQYGFSDMVVLGDTRPLHTVGLAVAKRYGTRVHVIEEGYFRPNWLTLEQGGINGFSRLPKDPDWYRQTGRLVPSYADGEAVPNPVRMLALHEVGYHLPNLLNPLLYKGYRTHRPHISPVEFYGWGTRFARMPLYERRD